MSTSGFGDLRALLQQRATVGEWYWSGRAWHKARQTERWWLEEERWRAELRERLLSLSRRDPVYYDEVCLPYLEQFPALWRYPLAERWLSFSGHGDDWPHSLMDIAPKGATFAFHAVSNALNGSLFRKRAKNPIVASMLEGYACVNVFDHAVMEAGAENLAQMQELRSLQQLVLRGCHIGNEGLRALGGSMYLDQLEVLDASQCSIDDEGVDAFVDSLRIKGLRVVSLAGNKLTERALEMLLCSPSLDTLTWLDVRGNVLGQDAAQLVEVWLERRGRPLDVRLG